ncbi:hypothetical protein [Cohnella abietis]|uniref:Uncharacterized protein n=1 Tax=Cohnella abietis TaxID=2507935 RepID=A0A3T1D1P8_9BACL|nr:hypothetical protein [Cohnella abietis]BBI32016.1 hypothetical protein KCTCHS21_14150 [Cohnella abietis]
MEYLLIDPRPDLPDSRHWQLLLRYIPLLEDKSRAYDIHTLLWSFRCYGTVLKYNSSGLFFFPTLDEKCTFDNQEEFNVMKDKCFRPYRDEIAQLLRKVAGNE